MHELLPVVTLTVVLDMRRVAQQIETVRLDEGIGYFTRCTNIREFTRCILFRNQIIRGFHDIEPRGHIPHPSQLISIIGMYGPPQSCKRKTKNGRWSAPMYSASSGVNDSGPGWISARPRPYNLVPI